MTQDKPQSGDETARSPEELREQVETTRKQLGETVEALTAKTDVKARAHEQAEAVRHQVSEKTTQVKARAHEQTEAVRHQVSEKTALVKAQVRDRATHAADVVHDKTPEPVWEKAGQGVRAARSHRTPLLAAGGALVAVLLARRYWRRR
ncbi:DUF3618 domain-containing protein [Streptomyces sp. NPDC001595]|uniref:DUF3618 domain-containing protein n=1 Tax=Streptomyces sp. NPDC001532 TaxID=3154520 RepID=UPI003330E148